MPLTIRWKRKTQKVKIIQIVFNLILLKQETVSSHNNNTGNRSPLTMKHTTWYQPSLLFLFTWDNKLMQNTLLESFHLSLQVRIPFSATYLLTLLPKRILIQILLHRTNLLSMRIPILLNRTKATLLILSMTGPKILKRAILS